MLFDVFDCESVGDARDFVGPNVAPALALANPSILVAVLGGTALHIT